MKNTHLVQRLDPPRGDHPLDAAIEAFSFGGGYRNGGLSSEAMALLRPIFSFDYMGAAEFEFGAVPKALAGMADRARVGAGKRAKRKAPGLTAFEFLVTHPVRPVAATADTAENDVHRLYGICDPEHVDEVTARVQAWVLPHGERLHMKESPMLDRALDGDEWCRTRGWLELDNGFFVFLDREMWAKTAALFELEVDACNA